MASRRKLRIRKNPTTPGTTFTKRIVKGPNKGDTVRFKIAKGGKPFPTAVVKDRGNPSTLRDNNIPIEGRRFGKTRRNKFS